MPDFPAFPDTIFRNETDAGLRTELSKQKLESWAANIKSYIDSAVAAVGGGGGGGFWLPASVLGVSAAADSLTNRNSLQNAVNVLPPKGGTIVLEAADFEFDISQPIQIGAKHVKIIGAGFDATNLITDNENSSASNKFFQLSSTGSLELHALTITGPSIIAAGGRFDAVHADGSSGYMKAFQCGFDNFTSALRVSSNVNWLGSVEAYQCWFDGYGGSGVNASTPILTNSQGSGSRGRFVRVSHCDFYNFGDAASGLHHGLYISSDFDVEVLFCKFDTAVGTGYCLQMFDGNVADANASYDQKFIGNHISWGLPCRGVVSGARSRILIADNFFGNNHNWIVLGGGQADIERNKFAGGITGNTQFGITTSIDQPLGPINFSRNKFTGICSRYVDISTIGEYNFSNNYWAAPTNAMAYDVSVQTSSNSIVRFDGDIFRGNAGLGHIRATNGIITVFGCYFRSLSGACIVSDGTSLTYRIVATEFSQVSGSSFQQNSIPSLEARANYGISPISDNPPVGGGGSSAPTLVDLGTITANQAVTMADKQDAFVIVTLGANGLKVSFTNWSAGKSATLMVRQDATGGRTGYSLSPAKWPRASGIPTLPTTPNAESIIGYIAKSATDIYGFEGGLDFV